MTHKRIFLSLCIFYSVWVICPAVSIATPPSNSQLLDFYSYDDGIPLNPEEELVYSDSVIQKYSISFDAVDGERITGFLIFPITSPSPFEFPVILYLHGYNGYAYDPIVDYISHDIMPSRDIKYSILTLDARYHGLRAKPNRDIFSTNFIQDRNALAQTVIDYRRAIDYIFNHNNITETEIHVLGVSMGGMIGTLLTAVDQRVRAASLIVAGGNWAVHFQTSDLGAAVPIREFLQGHYEVMPMIMDIVDPLVLAPLISPRHLQMHNAVFDETVTTGQLLFDAALQPKEIYWYMGDHVTIFNYNTIIFDRTLDLFDQQ